MDALSSSDVCLFGPSTSTAEAASCSDATMAAKYMPVSIGSRALAVLGALTARPGDLVSRDEIMRAAWPGTVVEEGNLAVQISALRRILDAGSEGVSCIQTVSGRGYRFVPRVTRHEEKSGSLESEDAPLPWRRRRRGGGAVVLLAILTAGFEWTLHDQAPPRPAAYSPQDRRQSVIVLPCENSSGDPAQDSVAAGVSRDVMDKIAEQEGSTVPFPSSRRPPRYVGKTARLRGIGATTMCISRSQGTHAARTAA